MEARHGLLHQAGLRALLQEEDPDQIVLMLCDQPFVDGRLLSQLISAQQESSKDMVACSYGDSVGVPALLGRKFFPSLLEMDDAEGAKKMFQNNPEDLAVVPFELGNIDIDTADDYRRLMGHG